MPWCLDQAGGDLSPVSSARRAPWGSCQAGAVITGQLDILSAASPSEPEPHQRVASYLSSKKEAVRGSPGFEGQT